MKIPPWIRNHPSTLFLLLSNLATMAFALVERWDLSVVMWIYWGQSVVIGFFNWRRILSLRQFSTENFTMNDQPVDPTPSTRRQVAFFFLIHYGFFHLVYFVFLGAERGDLPRADIAGALICVTLFAVNHRFSYRHHLERDLARKPNIGSVMMFPYARIVPMHLTILFGNLLGAQSARALLFFLGLKTLADVIMHKIEHADRPSPSSTPCGPDAAA